MNTEGEHHALLTEDKGGENRRSSRSVRAVVLATISHHPKRSSGLFQIRDRENVRVQRAGRERKQRGKLVRGQGGH